MFFRIVLFIWEFVLDVAAVSRLTEGEKDLAILLLRQQLRIVERKQERGPQIPRWQKVPLAVAAVRLKQKARHARQALEDSIRLFKPCAGYTIHPFENRRKLLSLWRQPYTPTGRNVHHALDWPGLRPGFVLKGVALCGSVGKSQFPMLSLDLGLAHRNPQHQPTSNTHYERFFSGILTRLQP